MDPYADPSGANRIDPSLPWGSSAEPVSPALVAAGGNAWCFPPPESAHVALEDWASWGCGITAVLPLYLIDSLGAEWTVEHVYTADSQVCRRLAGGAWVACKNVGVPLAVCRRPGL